MTGDAKSDRTEQHPGAGAPQADSVGNASTRMGDDPEARLYTSEPLEDDDGETYVIQQQNVGPGSELGGGEWPDPKTPPRPPAPGAS